MPEKPTTPETSPKDAFTAVEREVVGMRRRARGLRVTGIFLLLASALLLAFGGYVFFEAGSITTRDYKSTLEKYEAMLENSRQQEAYLEMQRARSIEELTKLREEISKLKPATSPELKPATSPEKSPISPP